MPNQESVRWNDDQDNFEEWRPDHSFWWMFYSQLLSEIGLNDDAVRDQLVASIRNSGNWDIIRPGTAEQLE